MPIQDDYNNVTERGQMGMVSRPNAPFNGERIKIGATGLKAGNAFKLDGSGDAIPMASATDASQVEGVLGYEAGMINDATGVIPEYAVGAQIPYTEEGYVYGVAGGTISKGDQVVFVPSTQKWTASSLAVVDQKKMLTAAQDAVANQLFEIKVGARVPSMLGSVGHDATYTIGAEAGDVIKVTAQLTDAEGNAVAGVQIVDVLLSDAATGIGLVATAPSGTVAIAAKGTLLASPVEKKHLTIQTDENGQYDLNITEAGVKTLYVATILMDGSMSVSGAVTFA